MLGWMRCGFTKRVIQGLKSHPPSLIIESYRTKALAEFLDPIIEQSYVSVGNNVLIPGRWLEAGQTQYLSVLQSRKFKAIDSVTGKSLNTIVIDGETVSLPYQLETGRYSVTSPGSQSIWFVPASSPIELPVGPIDPKVLFENIYAF